MDMPEQAIYCIGNPFFMSVYIGQNVDGSIQTNNTTVTLKSNNNADVYALYFAYQFLD